MPGLLCIAVQDMFFLTIMLRYMGMPLVCVLLLHDANSLPNELKDVFLYTLHFSATVTSITMPLISNSNTNGF